MEYILCKSCETGNPAYFQSCDNCGANLFESAEDTAAGIAADGNDHVNDEEKRSENHQRTTGMAISISICTTAFKIWLLYSLKANAHRDFPSISDISFIALPIIVALIMAFRRKKWHRALFADSFIMAMFFVIGLFFFIAGTMNR